jgi:hypothetical protein
VKLGSRWPSFVEITLWLTSTFSVGSGQRKSPKPIRHINDLILDIPMLLHVTSGIVYMSAWRKDEAIGENGRVFSFIISADYLKTHWHSPIITELSQRKCTCKTFNNLMLQRTINDNVSESDIKLKIKPPQNSLGL